MTTFTDTWNAAFEASPADSDDLSEGALRIRKLKVAISERLEVDHSWAGDSSDGQHKTVTFKQQAGNPISATDTGFLFTKDVSGKTELFWMDEDGNVLQLTSAGSLDLAQPLPLGYLSGGELSRSGVSTLGITDFDARSDANDENLNLNSDFTKTINSSWTAGTGNGGLSSSLTLAANTWYHVLGMNVSGTTDVGFDTSVDGANLVTDHSATGLRRLGSFLTDADKHVVNFLQSGDHFEWVDPALDEDMNPSTTASLQTLRVPPGVSVLANFALMISGSGSTGLYVSNPNQTDSAPSKTAAPLNANNVEIPAGATTFVSQEFWKRTNTSKQVRTRNLSDESVLRISTYGWVDYRGK